MAGVDVGGGGGRKKATNADINMIPFIDLLMVTIAFLLITAVWVTNSRVHGPTRRCPGPNTCDGDCKQATEAPHAPRRPWARTTSPGVEARRDRHQRGPRRRGPRVGERRRRATTSSPRRSRRSGRSTTRTRIRATARATRASSTATTARPSASSSAVLDAINATQRDYRAPATARSHQVPAFRTTFAVR